MWPTLDALRRLTTGTVLTLDRHGPCRFVRLRQQRAHFVRVSDEQRVNLWFVDLTPPPAPAAVRAPFTPPWHTGARTDDEE